MGVRKLCYLVAFICFLSHSLLRRMTETSPLGTIGLVKHSLRALSAEEKLQVRSKQGVMLNGIDLRIVDQFGTELPHDGVAVGDLQGTRAHRDSYETGS